MNGLLDRIAAPYRRDARRDARASLPAYQRGVMLSQPQSYQSLLGVPSIQIPTAPAAPSSSLAMLNALQRPEVAERLDRQRQEDDFSMRRRLGLLQDVPPPEPRPRMPQDTFLGRLGGGIKSAAQEIGGLFEGEEGRARAAALSRSLLRGPSRTPISLGQSVVEGLAAGGEEIERMEQRKFAKEQRARQKKQIEAQNKLADVLADPEATDAEKKSAFKAAYPVEAFKAEGKPVDLVKQIGTIAIGKLLKEPPEPLSKVERDAYNKLMSAGDSGIFKELMDRGIISMPDAPESAQPRDTSVIPLPADRGASDRFNVKVVDSK